MKVLLLSVKAGYGHHSTAKAIMEYFEENGHQCHMLDIFDYVNHRLGNSIQDGYLLSTKYLAKTYAEGLRANLHKKDEPYDRNFACDRYFHDLFQRNLKSSLLNMIPI